MKVVIIHALWCIGCIKTIPNLKEVLKNYSLELKELDYDMDIEEVEKYNVGKVLPVIIIEDENNNEIARISGEKNKSELQEFLESNLVK